MGKLIDHGWQKSAAGAAQPTGIIMGANLVKKKPNDKIESPDNKPKDR
jgi:hypothetical protein|tara:strand:- start:263 stop:406 length:144 start_codon:yes stop_codon:yes gene_type:complete